MANRVIRYTLEQLFNLNIGQELKDPNLIQLFDSYPQPKTRDYYNKKNKRFNAFNKLPNEPDAGAGADADEPKLEHNRGIPIKTEHVFSDKKVIEDIRRIVNQITQTNTDQIVDKLNQLSIPNTQVENVATVFFKSMIECEFLVDSYLKVLFGFTNQDTKLMRELYKRFTQNVIKEFKYPTEFKDTQLEKGRDREARWRLATCKILSKMYIYQYPSAPKIKQKDAFHFVRVGLHTKTFCKEFLDVIFNEVTPKNHNTTQILLTVWTILHKRSNKLAKLAPGKHAEYLNSIQKFVNSKDYKMTDKVMLMSLLDNTY